MSALHKITRRRILQQMGLGTGALVLGAQVGTRDVLGLFTETTDLATKPFSFGVYLAIDGGGTVTILAHRSEMGQGIRTGLPAVVADELDADWSRVKVVQAPGDPDTYGNQNTDGSRSVRQFFQPMREAGATARHMLEAAAAETWGVDAAECKAKDHQVWHEPSKRSLGFGELALKASRQTVPEASTLRLKKRQEFRYIGKDLPIVDLDDMVTGRADYGADVFLPGMLVAAIERCPDVGATIRSLDDKEARKVKGVRRVVRMDHGGGVGGGFLPLCGVAVVADHTWAALEGRKALKVEWEPGSHGAYDSAEYRQGLEATATKAGKIVREEGDVKAALEGAHKRIRASYYVPHLSQAPMEPPCAVADVKEGRCEIWAPTQNPAATRATVAQALGVEPDAITIHVTLLGGGFGRKSKPDFIAEAALLSREMKAPVKVQWTRTDDIRHGYFHAVSTQSVEAGVDEAGKPVAWHHRTVFPTIGATFNADNKTPSSGELGLGLLDIPFAVPNLCLEAGDAEAHLRIGWMRSVANIYHAFAVSSFADELAAAAGRDPKDYLLELIGEPRKIDLKARGVDYGNYGEPFERYPLDTGRLRNVVEIAAKKAGWKMKRPAGRALGIAAHRSFLSYVAVVAEVSVTADGKLTVHDITCAADCGTFVNRDRVVAQMEGGVIYGLSLALYSNITAKNGAVEQSNFHNYKVARMHQVPHRIGVHLVESTELPAGAGEPGTPPVAPALANAIFAATGRRYRELPLLETGYLA